MLYTYKGTEAQESSTDIILQFCEKFQKVRHLETVLYAPRQLHQAPAMLHCKDDQRTLRWCERGLSMCCLCLLEQGCCAV